MGHSPQKYKQNPITKVGGDLTDTQDVNEVLESVKAGRRMNVEMVAKLSEAKTTLDEIIRWANYNEEEQWEGMSPMPSGFKVVKGEDGVDYWIATTTNSFYDRDKEVFSQKALEECVDWMNEGNHGELWISHLPVRIGAPIAHGMFGRFLVEVGTFDDTSLGQKAKTFFQTYKKGLEMSPGFYYDPEDKSGGVYNWLRIKERSILEDGLAANRLTWFVGKGEEMNVKDLLQGLFRKALGEEGLEALEAETKVATETLEGAGIGFKAADEVVEKAVEKPVEVSVEVSVENPKAEPEEKPDGAFVMDEEAVKAIADHVGPIVAEALAQPFADIAAAIKALGTRLEQVEVRDEVKIANKMAELPRISFRPTQSAPVIDPTSPRDQEMTKRAAGTESVIDAFIGAARRG